jgi:hypothetical protein
LVIQGSQTRLRACIQELLWEAAHERLSSDSIAEVVAKADELLEVDAGDTRHLFFEEMKRIFFAMREIQSEDLDEEMMDEFRQAIDQVSNVLYRIEKCRQKRKNSVLRLQFSGFNSHTAGDVTLRRVRLRPFLKHIY